MYSFATIQNARRWAIDTMGCPVCAMIAVPAGQHQERTEGNPARHPLW